MIKSYSLPERTIKAIKEEADKLELGQSDMLRRMVDQYRENNKTKE